MLLKAVLAVNILATVIFLGLLGTQGDTSIVKTSTYNKADSTSALYYKTKVTS